jgi:hypothetical protein
VHTLKGVRFHCVIPLHEGRVLCSPTSALTVSCSNHDASHQTCQDEWSCE